MPPLKSTDVIQAPNGHAYRHVAAPGLSWDQARRPPPPGRPIRGIRGTLATIDDKAEFDFPMTKGLSRHHRHRRHPIWAGGKPQPGQWRWVTGPDGAADGGKGQLFWKGL